MTPAGAKGPIQFGADVGGPGYVDVRSGVDGAQLFHLTSPGAAEFFHPARIGDADGDGFDDFLVAASGAAYVYHSTP